MDSGICLLMTGSSESVLFTKVDVCGVYKTQAMQDIVLILSHILVL